MTIKTLFGVDVSSRNTTYIDPIRSNTPNKYSALSDMYLMAILATSLGTIIAVMTTLSLQTFFWKVDQLA